MYLRFCVLLACLVCSVAMRAAERPPELVIEQPGVRLSLVAEHPDVVTPTGIDVDEQGDVWVVASHTHFRPDDYSGPPHDEIIVISPDKKRRVFYAKTDATMDLELGDGGWVYLAERDRIMRVRDMDGDGVGDDEQTLAALETAGNYPHNGLAGLAWHPDGDLVFSLGENHWEEWTLRGVDGVTVHGTGEGGVFRCTADGENLRRVAKGFWNPFGICVRADGSMFAAENDPGARPPCRLLHVVEGGDYGYQRLYGSAPFHPFVCWNGELRGTLPMVHPIGEAPCGIAPLGDGLVVPSWTDNRVDFYALRPKGATFAAERIALIRGGLDFRPTGISQTSPTEFYLADWVHGSYEIHGKGRVWKLEVEPDEASWLRSTELTAPTDAAVLAEKLRSGNSNHSQQELFALAAADDAFIARAAIDALAKDVGSWSFNQAQQLDAVDQVALLLAVRKADPQNVAWVRHFLQASDPEVQFETLRWIADERMAQFLPVVEERLRSRENDYRLFEACLATWNTLSGSPRAGVADPKMLIERLRDDSAAESTRAFALRLIDPSYRGLDEELLDRLIAKGDAGVTREAVRTLAARGTAEARERLLRVATEEKYSVEVRADAIAGLANAAPESRAALLQLAADEQRPIREESLRSLRFAQLDAGAREELRSIAKRYPESKDLITAALHPESLSLGRPAATELEAWRRRLAEISQPTDREAGRRIFYHASVGTCSKCHRRDGRGNVVGPDLSAASTLEQEGRLLTALLQPSRDVAPQYYPWVLVTVDGHTFTGIPLRNGGGGTEIYRDDTGREQRFSTSDIAVRRELTTSMMPDGLCDTMTDREIRDLLAFLADTGEDAAVDAGGDDLSGSKVSRLQPATVLGGAVGASFGEREERRRVEGDR